VWMDESWRLDAWMMKLCGALDGQLSGYKRGLGLELIPFGAGPGCTKEAGIPSQLHQSPLTTKWSTSTR
jgi:hypothetical protein